jgi:hypothetical protein
LIGEDLVEVVNSEEAFIGVEGPASFIVEEAG